MERIRGELWPAASSCERPIVLWWLKVMKKVSLRILLLALVVAELYLCSAFTPASWQTALVQALSHVSPKKFDYSVVTHPALGYEIDDMLRKNTDCELVCTFWSFCCS